MSQVQAVKDAHNIIDVIGSYLQLQHAGSNYRGLCPFHSEKSPSFFVSETMQRYKCFGCGKAGGAINFVMEHEGYDYPEAIRYLAGKYSIQLEETQADAETIQAERERETIYKVLEFAWQYYKSQLHDTEEGQVAGLNYFIERGFRTKTIESFGLGYAPDKADGLIHEAKKAGFTLDILQRAGLITQHGGDFFRHRVMFPIFNISGKVIAFAGRQMVNSKRGPKYINSPETEIYVKRKVLYGCLLYTSDAADERSSVDLGGRRIIKKNNSEDLRSNRTARQTNNSIYKRDTKEEHYKKKKA